MNKEIIMLGFGYLFTMLVITSSDTSFKKELIIAIFGIYTFIILIGF